MACDCKSNKCGSVFNDAPVSILYIGLAISASAYSLQKSGTSSLICIDGSFVHLQNVSQFSDSGFVGSTKTTMDRLLLNNAVSIADVTQVQQDEKGI